MLLYVLYFITSILVIDYALFIRKIISFWKSKEEVQLDDNVKGIPFVSIVIAARNEERRIEECLLSISANNFSKDKYEIILIDDHSEDETVQIASNLQIPNLRIFSLGSLMEKNQITHTYKKEALKRGVQQSKGDLILFTDADVIVPQNWIKTMSQYITFSNKELVTGPIMYKPNQSFLQQFQAMDIAGTMMWTASGIWSEETYLANGANMIVKKSSYLKHMNNRGRKHVSGDDVFLIQSIAAANPNNVDFIKSKNAIVTTFPEETWKALINQRLRWAGKTTSYGNKRLIWKIGKVFGLNLGLVILCLFGIFSLDYSILALFIFVCFLKGILEHNLSMSYAKLFNLNSSIFKIMSFSLLHILFIVSVGQYSLLKPKIVWNDRKI